MAKRDYFKADPDLYFTIEETAFLLRRPESAVRRMIKDGAIQVYKSPNPSRRWRQLVPGDEIGRILNAG